MAVSSTRTLSISRGSGPVSSSAKGEGTTGAGPARRAAEYVLSRLDAALGNEERLALDREEGKGAGGERAFETGEI
jgi:hypothetical protein